MSTERLYWHDAYLREWSAQIIASDQQRVALDRSAFYPEVGGQPADHGWINGVAVVDVQIDEQDVIWHTLAEPIEATSVECRLDWQRRFDHMQQHHGQHLLSAAFDHLFNWRTVGFHLSAEYVTIDLTTSAASPEQLAEAEDLANQIIWQNLPILARFVSEDELASIALRKAPTVTGAIRVVSAGDFDHSACGGTHPNATGAVGQIHIRRSEKRGDSLRIEFVCGGRALQDLRWKNAMLGRIAAGFSVAPNQAEQAVERLREQEQQLRKQFQQAEQQLLEFEAKALVEQAQTIGQLKVVAQIWQREPQSVRQLANLVAQAGGVALFGVAASKPQLIFAGQGLDCGASLRQVVGAFGGKGGGSAQQAQGGIAEANDLAAALDLALSTLS
ncbi:alanyl-tRNA editing protein [Herpetosiphon giganteus]|uniref:alanyl-tRNA editing protein n=1 Tax=Herpetosiphon giganteus TaxID=2029754 RepID=UPI00195C3FA2|nr:alanyl-tRNA editing protein [Herpetosiphon giganteus]MBM7841631.1 alanyl-tRNA synthetase [Herpetosiphon giganteus]